MFEIPARQRLAALSEAANAIGPSAALGFVRRLGLDRVSVLYTYDHGMGEWVLPRSAVPEVLAPSTDVSTQADTPEFACDPNGALERFLYDCGVQRVASATVPEPDHPARFWIGFTRREPLSPDRLARVAEIASASVGLLTTTMQPDQAMERLRRLELATGLMAAVQEVLDVRHVFDRLSDTAKQALPHDLLLLILFSQDLSTFSVHARSGRGSGFESDLPNRYPPATVRAWQFDIVDDYTAHPLERHNPVTGMGARSALRVPIRFGDQVIGGVAFISFATRQYAAADVPIGRRLAEYVGVALSHYQLAEEGRRAAALRERTANLELLDELLETAVDSGEVPDVFGRITAIAGKVLRHDAAALTVRLPDGVHGRVYASSGFPEPLPEVIELPEDLLRNLQREHDVFDDLSTREEPRYVRLTQMGFRSLLRTRFRLKGEFAGVLNFLAKEKGSFRHDDVLVARRIADRIAVALARDRELAATRRADEATARAVQLEARVRALTDELDARTGYRRVVGESRQWRQVLTQATQVAATSTTVLLLGESGTGKEVIARFLHRGSARSGGAFVAINCAALPEQLLEAELFGYDRGAYTGATQSKPGQLEQAAGGTLFLDEVAEMSPSAQAKFLRVLQEREFQRLGGTRVLRADVRVIAATNRDLPRSIANGRFREDLYYRLNVFAIQLPPLRERRDDILPLSEAFLGEIGRGLGRPPSGISRDARQLLIDYHWPGNVRELRNILERAAILCDGGLITAEHLALTSSRAASPAPSAPAATAFTSVAAPDSASPSAAVGDLQTMERTMIEQALQNARFNKSKAAKALGLTRRQLYIRMRRHGFD